MAYSQISVPDVLDYQYEIKKDGLYYDYNYKDYSTSFDGTLILVGYDPDIVYGDVILWF